MPGLIRRTLLIGGAVAAAGGGYLLWRNNTRPTGPGDEPYGRDARQTLDISTPGQFGPAAPILMVFHDGAFSSGDKTDVPIWPEFLETGIAVVRVNTRLAPAARWPAPAEDALAAVVHLQRHGPDKYPPLDPSRLVLMGHGAGSFLAVTTAISLVEVGLPPRGVVSLYGSMDFSTMDEDLAALGRKPTMGATDAADSPESRLLGFAVGENRAAARAMGPIGRLDQMREPLPPILIRHGDADPRIADLQANRLREAWAKADPAASIDYALVAGAGHGGAPFETDPVRADILAFVTRALA